MVSNTISLTEIVQANYKGDLELLTGALFTQVTTLSPLHFSLGVWC